MTLPSSYAVLQNLDLPQSDAAKREQQEDEEEAFAAFLLWLLMRLEAGEITEDEFTLLAGDGIKLYHWAAAVTGKGTTQLDGADWGIIGMAVAAQFYYLRELGNVLAGFRAAGEAFTDGIRARVRMYAHAARGTFWRAWSRTKGSQLMKWRLNPAEHCPDCLEREGKVYPANALPWWPRDGSTQCLTNCMCEWVPVPTDEWGDYEEVRLSEGVEKALAFFTDDDGNVRPMSGRYILSNAVWSQMTPKEQAKARKRQQALREKDKQYDAAVKLVPKDDPNRDAIIDAILSSGIPPEHFAGLNGIVSSPTGNWTVANHGWTNPDRPYLTAIGLYSPQNKTVHIYSDQTASTNRSTLVHEVGHHVSMTLAPQSIRAGMHDTAWSVFNVLHGSKPRQLAKYGLRDYSLTNEEEFWAESYGVWRLGSRSQKTALKGLISDRAVRTAGNQTRAELDMTELTELFKSVLPKGELYEMQTVKDGNTFVTVLVPSSIPRDVAEQIPWYFVGRDESGETE